MQTRGGSEINSLIEEFVQANSDRAYVTKSFGHRRYLSVLNQCDGMVGGNSSSAIIEAAVCKKGGAVNIGIRQMGGRVRGANVIDCGVSSKEISPAVTRLLSADFQSSLANLESPYGDGKTAEKIVSILKGGIDTSKLKIKRFYDMEMK